MYKTYCRIRGAHIHVVQNAGLSELRLEQIRTTALILNANVNANTRRKHTTQYT
jgi:hypothetical protein